MSGGSIHNTSANSGRLWTGSWQDNGSGSAGRKAAAGAATSGAHRTSTSRRPAPTRSHSTVRSTSGGRRRVQSKQEIEARRREQRRRALRKKRRQQAWMYRFTALFFFAAVILLGVKGIRAMNHALEHAREEQRGVLETVTPTSGYDAADPVTPETTTAASAEQNVDGLDMSDPTHVLSGGRYVDTTKPMVALTWDDGPDSKVGNRLMDYLEAVDGRGTFFMVGNRVSENQDEVKRMVQDGHEVARGSTVVIGVKLTIIAQVDTTVDVATLGGSARTEEGLLDIHSGLVLLVLVEEGVVVVTIHNQSAFAAVKSLLGKVGTTGVVAPVGATVDGTFQHQFLSREGGNIAISRTRFELCVGIGVATDGSIPNRTFIDSRKTHIDVSRTVDHAQIAGTIDVVLHHATSQVQHRRGTFGGVGLAFTFRRVSVADLFGTAIDRLVDGAAIHVQHLEAVNHETAGVVTGTTGIDVLRECAAMDIDQHIGIIGSFASDRALRSSVSDITSAVNESFPMEVTVRQTPLTAMLSPIFVPSSTLRQPIVSTAECAPRLIHRISPISSIIPVNVFAPPFTYD